MKTLRAMLVLFVLLTASFELPAQSTIYVDIHLENCYTFYSGYWVYQDSATLELDSIILIELKHGFYGPNPAIPNYREYYQLTLKHVNSGETYNEFYIVNEWKRNGGGTYGELGQPVFWVNISNHEPYIGYGYNGFEMIALFDSIAIGDNTFYQVCKSTVYADEQYQHEFDFDTDLYFAPHIGIVRMDYFDEGSVHHVWNLVNWDVDFYTQIHKNNIKNTTISINNISKQLHIISGLKNIEAVIYSSDGKPVLTTRSKTIDLNRIKNSGIYIILIVGENGEVFWEKFIL